MKYIKRVLIILFFVIMISGCKVNYELQINKDLSVNEKVTATENTNRMKSRTNLDISQSVSYLYKIYKTSYMGDDNYSIISADSTTSATVNNSYSSIEEYSKNFKTDIFEEKIVCKDKNHIRIEFDQFGLINTKASNRYVYDEIEVVIEVPFEVSDHNADKVVNNKYTWYVKADTDEYKNIMIEFDGNRPKNSAAIKFGDKAFSIGYEYLFIVAAVLAIIIVIVVVYIKNKKNNRM
ncbi:MAG: hypothetical protein IKZ96_04185 [Bacilli bacterium]|nr:hypothetical protein [Bacilli bacterium]